MTRLSITACILTVISSLPLPVRCEETSASADVAFARTVLSVLTEHCGDCHSGDSIAQGLDLSSSVAALAGSRTGAVIVPGKASESLLVQVLATESKPHMPPDGQLVEVEIQSVADRINKLSPDTIVGRTGITAADREHWSFQPIHRPRPPDVSDSDWPRTPIDRFVLAGLESAELQPTAPADRETLLRRIHFDLVGLPPSPDELDRFVNNPRPDAYGQAVAVENPVTVPDLHATILHLLGLDHERLTYRFQGRDYRLTDVSGRVLRPLLA